MAKMKTITMVKPHYIGNKSLSEAFSGIIKQQIENNILLHDTENQDKLLNIPALHGKIDTSNLLSESEKLC